MDIDQYLKARPELTTIQFAQRLGINEGQVRQWRYRHGNRQPGPAACVAIEKVTDGAVRRWDLRPSDWHRIWPELIGIDGAPAVPVEQRVA